MKPIKFKKSNAEIAKNQDEYLTLPAEIREDGEVISCWKFSFKERVQVLFGKNLYISMLTFKKPLQPLRPMIGYEEKEFTFWDINESGEKTNERTVKESNLTEEEKQILEANNIHIHLN